MNFMPSVIYLNDEDLQMGSNGVELVAKRNRPAVLMVQGTHCHFCTEAKPGFNAFAEAVGADVDVMSLQTDVAPQGAQMLMQSLGGRGVPFIVGAGRDGVFRHVHEGDRTPQSFTEFAQKVSN